jgi:hypothetical protein
MDILPRISNDISSALENVGVDCLFSLWSDKSLIESYEYCLYQAGQHETNDLQQRLKIPILNRSIRRSSMCPGCELCHKFFNKTNWKDGHYRKLKNIKLTYVRDVDNVRQFIPIDLPTPYYDKLDILPDHVISMDNFTLKTMLMSYMGSKYSAVLYYVYFCNNVPHAIKECKSDLLDKQLKSKNVIDKIKKSLLNLLDFLEKNTIYLPKLTLEHLYWDGSSIRIYDIDHIGWRFNDYIFVSDFNLYEFLPNLLIAESMNIVEKQMCNQLGMDIKIYDEVYKKILMELDNKLKK